MFPLIHSIEHARSSLLTDCKLLGKMSCPRSSNTRATLAGTEPTSALQTVSRENVVMHLISHPLCLTFDISLFKNQSTQRTSRVLVSLLSEPQTDQVFPDAVRKQQHMWFQTGVRNMQNNESEEMEDDHCFFPARSKCKVHAVRLRVQSKPRSLQDDMTRLRKVCVHRESKKDTATSPKIDSSAHQQFSRLCHAAHAQTLLTAHLPVSKRTSMSWRFFRHCRCCCPSNRLCSSHPASSLLLAQEEFSGLKDFQESVIHRHILRQDARQLSVVGNHFTFTTVFPNKSFTTMGVDYGLSFFWYRSCFLQWVTK